MSATKKQRTFNAAGGAFRPLSRKRQEKGQPVSWWLQAKREGFTELAASSIVDQPPGSIGVTLGLAVKNGQMGEWVDKSRSEDSGESA